MGTPELLHEIDKKLAVLETLSQTHALSTDVKFDHLEKQLDELTKEVSKLKLKVAGVASGISVFVAAASQLWG